jgi:TonB family protein
MKIGLEKRTRLALRRSGAIAIALAFLLVIGGRAAEERAIKSRVAPVYPEIAKRMRIAGVVKLEVTVDPDGKVTDVKALSGNSMLCPAAEDAVRKWKFAPGSATSVVDLDINFDMVQ